MFHQISPTENVVLNVPSFLIRTVPESGLYGAVAHRVHLQVNFEVAYRARVRPPPDLQKQKHARTSLAAGRSTIVYLCEAPAERFSELKLNRNIL